MENKSYPNIACSEPKISNALSRYLKYIFGFEKILLNPLNDPFSYKVAVNMAEHSKLLIIDAFIDGKSKGFHFAKQMKRKTLLLFYAGEINIEIEYPFLFVMPFKLEKLKKKINDIIDNPETSEDKYSELEKKTYNLRDNSKHHI